MHKTFIFLLLTITYSSFDAQNGILDYSFGDEGGVILDVQGTFDIVGGITIDHNGFVIVAGYSGENYMADKYVTVSFLNALGELHPPLARDCVSCD